MRRLLLAAVLMLPSIAVAKPAFAPGTDPELDRKMLNHTRVLYQISARPFGIAVSGGYKDAAALQTIKDYLAQDATDDFETATGVHPYTLLSPYEGAAGIGLRGAGAAPATAFRYMALKAEGAPKAAVDAARRDVVRAINAVIVAHTITGVPRVLARGLARMKSEEATGPTDIPLSAPTYYPLADDQGVPQPQPKNNGVDRKDNSGGALPADTWFWEDSCSKDQMVGWVLAMATLYDAAKGDPDIDQGLVASLQTEAREIGAGLRETHPFSAMDGQTYDYDLVIMDADTRPTLHWDLNPLSVDANVNLPPDSQSLNRFNMVMAMGIVKALYHVSGDPDAETFLYGELLGNRNYLDHLASTSDVDYIYMDANTNFSNVNMIAMALFLNVWFEKDPVVLARTRDYMETQWWNVAGLIQTAKNCKQPFFHALYLAMTDKGFDASLATQTATLLKAYNLEPYVDEKRNNCDPDELAAFECTALDGTTILHLQKDASGQPLLGWGKNYVATEALDPSFRPTSNFDARSNPFQVNSQDGSTDSGLTGGLNPGGDLNAAYWLLRWLPDPGNGVVSGNARDHMAVPGTLPDAVETVELVPEAIPETVPEATSDVVEPADTTSPDDVVRDAMGGDAVQADTAGIDTVSDAPTSDTRTSGGGGGGCASGSSGTPLAASLLALSVLLALRASRRSRFQS